MTALSRSSARRLRTGETTMTSPSVESSSWVSASIPSCSSSSLSKTSAKLFPVRVSLFRTSSSVRTWMMPRTNGIGNRSRRALGEGGLRRAADVEVLPPLRVEPRRGEAELGGAVDQVHRRDAPADPAVPDVHCPEGKRGGDAQDPHFAGDLPA